MAGLGTKLAKRGVGFAAGYELYQFSKRMKKERERMNEEEKNPVIDGETVIDYQFIFYEKAVLEILDTVSKFIEKVIENEVVIEDELYAKASKIINVMKHVLKTKEEGLKVQNGTEA